ncbi:DUF2628 domain-containing protein [Hydrogenoanaerobacterium sp.]|uniref:DUF2628 domain-containing protein n=1 Tax=Hydrogenoanaerobacterium sp. TaxID=2953763 RepID=UPI0028990EBE|nr:DUF2628 domain-containing protein [Hydrogenoanaerobacterium sp.]
MMGERTCPRCNAVAEHESNFCGNCGYDFTQGAEGFVVINETRVDGYLTADIVSYVGKKGEVYTEKFKAIEQKQITFNWCAFLFSGNWFAYRRLYGWAVGTILAATFIGIGIAAVLVAPLANGTISIGMFTFLSFAVGLLLRLACGFLGDRIYWGRVKKELNNENCKDRPATLNQRLHQRLGLAGSPSVLAVVISVVAGEGFVQLVTAFITPVITGMLL